jgi:hypothetical protein
MAGGIGAWPELCLPADTGRAHGYKDICRQHDQYCGRQSVAQPPLGSLELHHVRWRVGWVGVPHAAKPEPAVRTVLGVLLCWVP